MSHIHTDIGQHDLVVSMYIIRTDFDQPKSTLHVHKKHNVWMQFGGHVELNETPWQAVQHELLEESGYDLDQLHLLQPAGRIESLTGSVLHPQPVNINTHHIREDHGHIAIEYAFVTAQEPRHPLPEDESKDIKLFTRDELLAIPKDKIYEASRQILLYILDEYLQASELIPADSYEL